MGSRRRRLFRAGEARNVLASGYFQGTSKEMGSGVGLNIRTFLKGAGMRLIVRRQSACRSNCGVRLSWRSEKGLFPVLLATKHQPGR